MNWENLNYIFWTIISLLGIVGFVNAVFALKDRWRNWRALKNKNRFNERLKEIENLIEKTIRYSKNPFSFFADILREIIFPAISGISGLIIFVWYFGQRLIFLNPSEKQPLDPFAVTEMFLPILLLSVPIVYLMHLYEKLSYLYNPLLLLEETSKLIKEGNDRNFISVEKMDYLIERMENYADTVFTIEENPFFTLTPEMKKEYLETERVQREKLESSSKNEKAMPEDQ